MPIAGPSKRTENRSKAHCGLDWVCLTPEKEGHWLPRVLVATRRQRFDHGLSNSQSDLIFTPCRRLCLRSLRNRHAMEVWSSLATCGARTQSRPASRCAADVYPCQEWSREGVKRTLIEKQNIYGAWTFGQSPPNVGCHLSSPEWLAICIPMIARLIPGCSAALLYVRQHEMWLIYESRPANHSSFLVRPGIAHQQLSLYCTKLSRCCIAGRESFLRWSTSPGPSGDDL